MKHLYFKPLNIISLLVKLQEIEYPGVDKILSSLIVPKNIISKNSSMASKFVDALSKPLPVYCEENADTSAEGFLPLSAFPGVPLVVEYVLMDSSNDSKPFLLISDYSLYCDIPHPCAITEADAWAKEHVFKMYAVLLEDVMECGELIESSGDEFNWALEHKVASVPDVLFKSWSRAGIAADPMAEYSVKAYNGIHSAIKHLHSVVLNVEPPIWQPALVVFNVDKPKIVPEVKTCLHIPLNDRESDNGVFYIWPLTKDKEEPVLFTFPLLEGYRQLPAALVQLESLLGEEAFKLLKFAGINQVSNWELVNDSVDPGGSLCMNWQFKPGLSSTQFVLLKEASRSLPLTLATGWEWFEKKCVLSTNDRQRRMLHKM
jgi:hypothetical protein